MVYYCFTHITDILIGWIWWNGGNMRESYTSDKSYIVVHSFEKTTNRLCGYLSLRLWGGVAGQPGAWPRNFYGVEWHFLWRIAGFVFFFQGKWCIQTKVDSPTSPIVIHKCRGRWEAMIFRRVSSSHIPLQWSFFPWSFSVPAHRTPRRAVAPRSEAWLRQAARQQKKIKKAVQHIQFMLIVWRTMNNHEQPTIQQIDANCRDLESSNLWQRIQA